MIITLMGADFSSCMISTLTTVNVKASTTIGATVNISKSSVERAGYSVATDIATITLNTTNYERHVIKVMMGSKDVSSWYSSGTGKVTIPPNTPITSNITISVSATAVSGGSGEVVDPGTGGETEIRYSGTLSSGSWKAANVASYYKICNLNAGERLDSIQVKFGTNDVTPKMAIVNNSGEVLNMRDLNTISDTQSTTTNINYTASDAVTLCVGGVSGSMGYSTTNIATGSVTMSYCDITNIGETVTFKDGGNITFALEVTIIK